MTASPSEPDEDLAVRAKQGDRAAFEILIRRHKEDLYRFVRRYVGDAEDAYDILQNCFVSAWLGLPRYDPTRRFAPWLRTIALNKCRDFGRRQAVRRIFLRVFAQEQSATVTELSGSQDEISQIDARLSRLDQAIAELPALYKEPLLLTTVGGLTHEEAAAALKTTPKAVEMRLYRARRRLQAMLGYPEG